MIPTSYVLLAFGSFFIAFFGYIIRIERTLVRIQIELKHLKLAVPKCQPPSAQNTP